MAFNIHADNSWVTISRFEAELSATKEKLEAAEKRIRESQEQDAYGFWHIGETEDESDFFLACETGDVSIGCESCVKLYTMPPIPPELAELQRENANSKAKGVNMKTPELNQGEIYAGAIINPDGTGNHIILLDGDNDDASWEAQMDWAKSIGGDLPDRVEQAMLFKHLKDRFKADWYWSNTPHSDTRFAWNQGFHDGYQGLSSTNYQVRARAVRRIAI